MHNTLNIPVKLMKRFRKDKSMWELFIFALCVKMYEGSSALYPDVNAVRKLLNCSYYKAVRLIEGAKRCPALFRYYPKANLLVARSFTHGRLDRHEYASGRKTFTAYHAFCYKFRFDPEERISHFNISRQMKDVLLKQAIKARQLKHDLQAVVNTEYKISTRANRSTALLAVKLGRISGYHHTTVSRHIRKMEQSGEIKVCRPGYIKVADFKTGETLTDNPALLSRKPFLRGGYLVVRDANEYILSRPEEAVFVNVIFNHRSRHRRRTLRTVHAGSPEKSRLDSILAYLWN